ncbi:MAG: hypothetical protein C0497_05470 [Gemmatimonas sp.]|nr:hypothetical protein [Gemmatimonas sp.]
MPPYRVRGLTSVSIAISLAAICSSTTAASSSPGLAARAEVTAEGAKLELIERTRPDGTLERLFQRDAGQVLYRSAVTLRAGGFDVQILQGHPAQIGSFRVEGGQLEVRDAAGKPLWTETLKEPLCLPELFGEFVRAHWDRLSPGAAPLRCVTPIIKAKKTAPLQWRRLPDLPDGERVVELGPGSFGMRFFVIPTRLTFAADGTRLLAQQGQLEAPPRVDGRAAYLRGAARFTQTRTLADWPAQRFGGATVPP